MVLSIPCNQLENEVTFIITIIAIILFFKAIKWANMAGEATAWWFKEQFRRRKPNVEEVEEVDEIERILDRHRN